MTANSADKTGIAQRLMENKTIISAVVVQRSAAVPGIEVELVEGLKGTLVDPLAHSLDLPDLPKSKSEYDQLKSGDKVHLIIFSLIPGDGEVQIFCRQFI